MITFTIVQIGIICTSLYAGEILPLKLPSIHLFFDRKPFNCRPCFTFHLVWLQYAILSYDIRSWKLFLLGIAVSLAVYVVLKSIDNKKIIE